MTPFLSLSSIKSDRYSGERELRLRKYSKSPAMVCLKSLSLLKDSRRKRSNRVFRSSRPCWGCKYKEITSTFLTTLIYDFKRGSLSVYVLRHKTVFLDSLLNSIPGYSQQGSCPPPLLTPELCLAPSSKSSYTRTSFSGHLAHDWTACTCMPGLRGRHGGKTNEKQTETIEGKAKKKR